MNAHELYQAGKLTEAVAAALEAVKQAPTDLARRGFLCELCCFTGDLERADRQVETVGQQDPQAGLLVALYRQLIRAEQWRQHCFSDGRAPELLAEADDALRKRLQASIALREGRLSEAAQLLDEAEALRQPLAGTCNGQPFDDLRDGDDLTADVFEVLTSTGKYYWIPMRSVESLEFRKPERPRDLLWRSAHMVVRDGPESDVFLPTLYPGTHQSDDDNLRLGRATDWRGGEGEPVRGIGQRTFLVGDDARSILELDMLTIG